jgi:hypothetical protein
LGLCIVAAIACQEPLSTLECEQLLSHYTERLVLDEKPHASPAEVAAKQLAAQRAAKERPEFEFEACSDEVSRGQFDCAMAAASVDDVERCLIR